MSTTELIDLQYLLKFADVPMKIRHDLRRVRLNPEIYIGKSAYFWGNNGVGKSVLSAKILESTLQNAWGARCAVLVQQLKKCGVHGTPNVLPIQIPVKFCWFPVFLESLKAGFGQPLSNSQARLQEVAEVPFLVLDDIGVEMGTEWTYQILYLIVGAREAQMLPTVFTSNLSLQTLGEKLGDTRIVSRIAGMCGSNVFEITKKDFRLSASTDQ